MSRIIPPDLKHSVKLPKWLNPAAIVAASREQLAARKGLAKEAQAPKQVVAQWVDSTNNRIYNAGSPELKERIRSQGEEGLVPYKTVAAKQTNTSEIRSGAMYETRRSLNEHGTYNTYVDRHLSYRAIQELATFAAKNGMGMARARYLRSEHEKQAGQEYPTLNKIVCAIDWQYGRKQRATVEATISIDAAGKFIFPKLFKAADQKEYAFDKTTVKQLEAQAEYLHADRMVVRKSDQPTYKRPGIWQFNAVASQEENKGLTVEAMAEQVANGLKKKAQLSSVAIPNAPAPVQPTGTPQPSGAPGTPPAQGQKVMNPLDGKTYVVQQMIPGQGLTVLDPNNQQAVIPEADVQNLKQVIPTQASSKEGFSVEAIALDLVKDHLLGDAKDELGEIGMHNNMIKDDVQEIIEDEDLMSQLSSLHIFAFESRPIACPHCGYEGGGVRGICPICLKPVTQTSALHTGSLEKEAQGITATQIIAAIQQMSMLPAQISQANGVNAQQWAQYIQGVYAQLSNTVRQLGNNPQSWQQYGQQVVSMLIGAYDHIANYATQAAIPLQVSTLTNFVQAAKSIGFKGASLSKEAFEHVPNMNEAKQAVLQALKGQYTPAVDEDPAVKRIAEKEWNEVQLQIQAAASLEDLTVVLSDTWPREKAQQFLSRFAKLSSLSKHASFQATGVSGAASIQPNSHVKTMSSSWQETRKKLKTDSQRTAELFEEALMEKIASLGRMPEEFDLVHTAGGKAQLKIMVDSTPDENATLAASLAPDFNAQYDERNGVIVFGTVSPRQLQAMADMKYRKPNVKVDEKGRDVNTHVPVGEKGKIEVGLTEFPFDQKRDDSTGLPTKNEKGYRIPFKKMDENQVKDREHFDNEKRLPTQRKMRDEDSTYQPGKQNLGLSEEAALQKVLGIRTQAADEGGDDDQEGHSQPPEKPVEFKQLKKAPGIKEYTEPEVIEQAGGKVKEAITKLHSTQADLAKLQKELSNALSPLMESMGKIQGQHAEGIQKKTDQVVSYLNMVWDMLGETSDRVAAYEQQIWARVSREKQTPGKPSVDDVIAELQKVDTILAEQVQKVAKLLTEQKATSVIERLLYEYPKSKVQEKKVEQKKSSVETTVDGLIRDLADILSGLANALAMMGGEVDVEMPIPEPVTVAAELGETFDTWFEENKEGSLQDDYREYVHEMRLQGVRHQSYRAWAKSYYDRVIGAGM